MTETIKLYRPFAQVNFGTADLFDAAAAGFIPAQSAFTATDVANVFDTFNAEGKVESPATDKVTFAKAEIPGGGETLVTKDGAKYLWMTMNYIIPVGKQGEKHISNVTAEFISEAGDAITASSPQTPVQNNYRTNILGNLLTSQVIFNVEIVPIFNEPDYDIDLVNIKNVESLKALFATGGEATLAADLVLDESMAVKSGKEVVLDLNGKTVKNNSNSSAFNVYGSLVINGEGTVDGGEGGDNVAVWSRSGGKLTINCGTYTVGADANGSGNSTIYSTGGDVVINGGTFSNAAKSAGRYWTINKQNGSTGKVEIYGGTFPGFDPANPNTDDDPTYVAEGYVSVEKDGVWTVLSGVKDAAALKAVFDEGGVVALANDLVLDKAIAVAPGKEVTLDLNGKTISNTEDLWRGDPYYDWALLSVRADGSLTIKGTGVLKAKENDCYAVDVQDGGKLVIEDGTYVGNAHAVYVYEGTAEIKGGKYSIQQLSSNPDPYGYVLNCYDKNRENGIAKIIVTGGEFVKFNPADCWAEGAHTNFLSAGYKSVVDGTDTWKVIPE